MTWEEYRSNFSDVAIKSRKKKGYIDRCLKYAKPLFDAELPVVFDAQHLSKLVGLVSQYVFYMSKYPGRFYRSFSIKKRNGGERTINEPLPDLKNVQRWILDNILEKLCKSVYAKAFTKGLSIKDNARFHRNQNVVLSIDIKNFFPSVTKMSVFRVFQKAGYSNVVATILTNLCCRRDCLPQGAPSSPQLSNLVLIDLDNEIAEYTMKNGWRYTRYADDITVSGDVNVGACLMFFYSLLQQYGYQMNSDKTRVARRNSRQEVTGIVVNKHLQAPKNLRKQIRQKMYYINKYGLDSHINKVGEIRVNYLAHLIGLVGFTLFVNPKDKEMKSYYTLLQEISGARQED